MLSCGGFQKDSGLVFRMGNRIGDFVEYIEFFDRLARTCRARKRIALRLDVDYNQLKTIDMFQRLNEILLETGEIHIEDGDDCVTETLDITKDKHPRQELVFSPFTKYAFCYYNAVELSIKELAFSSKLFGFEPVNYAKHALIAYRIDSPRDSTTVIGGMFWYNFPQKNGRKKPAWIILNYSRTENCQ